MSNKIETKIDLGITRSSFANKTEVATLILTTFIPSDGGIRSSAMVMWLTDRSSIHFAGKGGDFTRRMASNPNVRATVQALDQQHNQVFTPEAVAELTADAKDYYEVLSSAKAA